jgi:hypothetical protein
MSDTGDLRSGCPCTLNGRPDCGHEVGDHDWYGCQSCDAVTIVVASEEVRELGERAAPRRSRP